MKTHGQHSTRPKAPAAAASPYLVSLTASSLDALGLTYVGTFNVATASGNVQVLRFTLSTGSLAGMSLTQACAGGVTTVTTSDSVSLGNTTFDAVSLGVTVAGTPLTFTVADPPTTGFPGEIVLNQITLTATTVSADMLTMPSFTTGAATC